MLRKKMPVSYFSFHQDARDPTLSILSVRNAHTTALCDTCMLIEYVLEMRHVAQVSAPAIEAIAVLVIDLLSQSFSENEYMEHHRLAGRENRFRVVEFLASDDMPLVTAYFWEHFTVNERPSHLHAALVVKLYGDVVSAR